MSEPYLKTRLLARIDDLEQKMSLMVRAQGDAVQAYLETIRELRAEIATLKASNVAPEVEPTSAEISAIKAVRIFNGPADNPAPWLFRERRVDPRMGG